MCICSREVVVIVRPPEAWQWVLPIGPWAEMLGTKNQKKGKYLSRVWGIDCDAFAFFEISEIL